MLMSCRAAEPVYMQSLHLGALISQCTQQKKNVHPELLKKVNKIATPSREQ